MEILRALFFLMLSRLPPTAGSNKPSFFPCDNDVNITAVDCSHRPLDHVPVIISRTVTSLNLSHTKIREVGRYAFSGVPNLHALKMMWNCLPGSLRPLTDGSCRVDIHPDAFRGLHKLHSLNLSGNSLSTLPWLPESVRVLDLQDNNFFRIVRPLGAAHLEELLLTKNCFYANPCGQALHIDEDVFKELSNLRSLTLGYNNLTAVPAGLPHSLEMLDLEGNSIPEIPEGAFANLTNLKSLNFQWNCQRCDHAVRHCFPCPNNDPLKLHPNSLYAKNSSMSYLNLAGNSLRTFPKGLFSPLRNLNALDLADNFLSVVIQNGTFFTELKQLTWISLIYNYEPLRTLPELILSQHLASITKLETLLLRGNFFHSVSEQSITVLSRLHELKTLELRLNLIRCCNMSALRRLTSLTTLDLSQNLLTFLTTNLSSGYTLRGSQNQTVFNDFSDVPIVQPARMDERVTDRALRETPDDIISDDNVTQIPTMGHFRTFYCQHNISINLSKNNIIFLHENLFVGMENAVCLDLSFNYMSQALTVGLLRHLENVVHLDMSYNRIDLYYDAFVELNNSLKVLDLSNNEFYFFLTGLLHRLAFIADLTQLEVLSLANNHIKMRIDQRLSSNSLKYLYFSGNRLDVMWMSGDTYYNEFFKGLKRLVYLDISQNQLHSISPDVLCNLPVSIEAVNISDNHLNYFPWQNITTLRNLRHLNLSGNDLSFLPEQVIHFAPDFAVLDLSENRISYLPLDFFSQTKALRVLHLNDNLLKELSFQSLPAPLIDGSALQKLTLHNNPFKCDCRNSGFAEFLQTSTAYIPYLTTGFKCEFPESQQGQSVLTVDRRSCQEIYGSIAFLFSFFFTGVFTVLSLLQHLYGWDLWYCTYILWAGFKGYSHGSCSQKHYDAFVVFDTDNQAVRDWVYGELIVHLESPGYRRFSLCLEERDWIPGLSRIENLHDAVYTSMKTVFVLSNGAAVNGVIRQAFFMVQQRLLDEKVDVAVLVLMDKAFPKLKYLQLRKRLCRKSVMSWPTNPRAQPLFWNKMRTALQSDNLQLYDNNVSESFT